MIGFLQLTQQLPADSIDLVVTSPPYNVDLGHNRYHKNPYDLYRDNREHSEYIEWLKTVFGEVHRVLKHGGRVAINIGDGKNGAVPTHSDVIHFMTKELGYLPMATIIWNKNQTSPRTAWGSWLSPSCPSFPMPFEYTSTEETPVVEAQEEPKPESKEPTEETLQDENTTDIKDEKTDDSKPKRRSKRSSARDSKDSLDEPKDDSKKEEDQEDSQPKRGRKPTGRRDRVIVMLDKETIEILDSFSISRSGTARAVILASQDFLAGLEGDIKEEMLVSKIKDKLS